MRGPERDLRRWGKIWSYLLLSGMLSGSRSRLRFKDDSCMACVVFIPWICGISDQASFPSAIASNDIAESSKLVLYINLFWFFDFEILVEVFVRFLVVLSMVWSTVPSSWILLLHCAFLFACLLRIEEQQDWCNDGLLWLLFPPCIWQEMKVFIITFWLGESSLSLSSLRFLSLGFFVFFYLPLRLSIYASCIWIARKVLKWFSRTWYSQSWCKLTPISVLTILVFRYLLLTYF